MGRRFAGACLPMLTVLLPVGTPALSAPGESARSTGQDDRFGGSCEPPLKVAAGACVRECPAAYRDTGLGHCVFQRMSD